MMSTDNLFTHYISIDFGTSGCAIAVGFSHSEPKNIKAFAAWGEALGQAEAYMETKCPTFLLVNPNGEFVSFGTKAFDAYKNMRGEQAQDYYLFHRFKMKLYDDPVRLMHVQGNC